MDVIQRKGRRWGGVYEVYEPNERNPHLGDGGTLPGGGVLRTWRVAQEKEWCLTDDGYQAEVLKREALQNGLGEKVYLTCGSGLAPRGKLLYGPRKRTKDYSSVGGGGKRWIDYEVRKQRTRDVVLGYCMMVGKGERVDWFRLGRMYRPEEKYPEKTVRRLFRQKEIQEMINEELKRLLETKGVGASQVMELLQLAEKKAIQEENAQVLVQLAEMYWKILNARDRKKKVGGEKVGETGQTVDQEELKKSVMAAKSGQRGQKERENGVTFEGIIPNIRKTVRGEEAEEEIRRELGLTAPPGGEAEGISP